MTDWPHTRKIAQLPGTRTTPQVALARTLEKAAAGKIKSVFISIEWDADGTFDCDWSQMPVGVLACHMMSVDREARRVFLGERPEVIVPPDKPA